MTNTTLDLIQSHGSVRGYKPDPVPAGMVEAIVTAAQRASTSSNLQVVSVVAATDPAVRERLSAICANQQHVAQAPLFLTWCADLARLDRACELRGYTQSTDYVESFLVAALDVGIAAQNAALAAESLGLGICYIGSLRNDAQAVIELLKLPRLVFPIVGMTVGWPVEEPHVRPRLPLSAVLHWGVYDPQPKDAELAEYDRVMAATGIYEGRQVPVPGRPGEMEDYGWTEHSARRAAQALRTDLREALRRQGYGLR
jgi:FMN reductase (NADPH)